MMRQWVGRGGGGHFQNQPCCSSSSRSRVMGWLLVSFNDSVCPFFKRPLPSPSFIYHPSLPLYPSHSQHPTPSSSPIPFFFNSLFILCSLLSFIVIHESPLFPLPPPFPLNYIYYSARKGGWWGSFCLLRGMLSGARPPTRSICLFRSIQGIL